MLTKYFLAICLIYTIHASDASAPEKLHTSVDEYYLNQGLCRRLSSYCKGSMHQMDMRSRGSRCPYASIPQPCNTHTKYRTFDGSCNHLDNPTWGMVKSPYVRLLPSQYQDGNYTIPLGVDGKPKPLARRLTTEFFSEQNHPDIVHLMTMQWGQVVAHDIAITFSVGDDDQCCNPDGDNRLFCVDLVVPEDDPFYTQFNVTCIGKSRNAFEIVKGKVEQVNDVTHLLDGSLLYGSNDQTADSLRTFENGKLRADVLPNGKDFLPKVKSAARTTLSPPFAPPFCIPSATNECYEAGDVRANQNPQLTALQNVLLREHNRIATELKKLHGEWDDERVFQESRAIVIAIIQHITYKEWLSLYLGPSVMRKHKLFPKSSDYTKFNSEVRPNIINSFTSSVFRFIHSAVQTNVSLVNESGDQTSDVHFSDVLNMPFVLKQGSAYDQFLLGLVHQPMQVMDNFMTGEISNKLFSFPLHYGRDLISFDVLRGRDNGLPGYTKYVEMCAGDKIRQFDDLLKYIPHEQVIKLQKMYKAVEDIDLYVGAGLEVMVPETRLGPTNLCIITEQFFRLKWGDRFWYEVGGQPHTFRKDQLQEIRKATVSRLLCDNGDNINKIPRSGFIAVSETNPIVACSELPKIDLSKWK